MSEPTGCADTCPRADTSSTTYCGRCDVLVGLPGLRVVEVTAKRSLLTVAVESPRRAEAAGCVG